MPLTENDHWQNGEHGSHIACLASTAMWKLDYTNEPFALPQVYIIGTVQPAIWLPNIIYMETLDSFSNIFWTTLTKIFFSSVDVQNSYST